MTGAAIMFDDEPFPAPGVSTADAPSGLLAGAIDGGVTGKAAVKEDEDGVPEGRSEGLTPADGTPADGEAAPTVEGVLVFAVPAFVFPAPVLAVAGLALAVFALTTVVLALRAPTDT